MSEGILCRIDGPLCTVTIDRPPLNVLTTAMIRALGERLTEAAARPEVRLVRIDARGRAFSAGVDVADHEGQRVGPMMDALAALFATLDVIPQPTLAVVQGAALGGGCEIVLGCDLCWAAERASFGQPEIRLGLFAPPASVLLPRLLGERRALGLLLGGDTLGAAEAERIGLVNRVWSEAEFERGVADAQQHLLELSGAALRLAKRAVRAGRGLGVAEAHDAVDRLYREELMRTADAHEGLEAFRAKRPARWTHA